MTVAAPVPVLADDRIYIGDNGATFCGEHAGMTARFSGVDLSGAPVEALTAGDRHYCETVLGYSPACETCGRTVAT